VQLTFSSPMPNSFVPLLKERIPNPRDYRDTMMARRWTQKEGLAMGILDEVVDGEKLMERATEVALREAPKCAPGPWGFIKVSHCRVRANVRNNHTASTLWPVSQRGRSYSRISRPRRSGSDTAGRSCSDLYVMHVCTTC
jgi:enoyl-CoA hydratase/carnithine racemase